MKRNWEYKKLGDVCTIVGRIGFRGYKRSDYVEGLNDGAISLSPSNINNGVLDYSKCTFISWEKYKESPEIMIENGDVLLVKTASVGKSAYVEHLPHETTINPQFVVLKHISANHKYIAYVVKSNSFLLDLKSITFGSSVPTISQKDLADLSIPVPPLEEQSRIVAELDLLTGIIDKQNAQLKELDNLAQAIFYDMFGDPIENPKGWNISHFSDICEVTSSKRVYQSEWQSSGIPFLRISDFSQLTESNDDIDAELFISKEKYDELKLNDQVPSAGDILVTARGTLGVCYIVKKKDCFYFQDGMITWLKNLDERVLSQFVVFLFKNHSFRRQIDKSQSGSTVAYLSISMLKKFVLPVPPLALQQSFAEKIQSIEKQKETIRASIADTQKLLDYTMAKYFG